MNPNPQHERVLLPVRNLEHPHVFQEIDCHRGDLPGVLVSVPNGKPGHDHVRIANCLDLRGEVSHKRE